MTTNANFCTLNSIAQVHGVTFKNGNTYVIHSSNSWISTIGTHGMRTGKWYWEAYQISNLSGNGFPVGIYDIDSGLYADGQSNDYPNGTSAKGPAYTAYSNSGSYASRYNGGTETNMSFSIGGGGDVWQIAVDLDNGKLWFGKNNTWDNGGSGTGNPATGANPSYSGGQLSDSTTRTWVPITCSYNNSNSEDYPQNWGQDSTFAGRISAGGNADGNGYGDFKYSPPSGFLALCSSNLNTSADIDPTGDDGEDENPTKQFNIALYTGTGAALSIDAGLQTDFAWVKSRGSQSHRLADSSRGSEVLFCDTTAATDTTAGISFDSDGFNWTNTDGSNANDNGANYVAYCWKGNSGTTASNTEGSGTSTVQANPKAGFSIVQFPNYSSNATFGHGLSSAPEFIIIKLTASGSQWPVYHTGLSSTGKYLNLQTTDAEASGSFFNSTAPTADVFSLGASFGGSGAGIAYLWHSVSGYSKFGYYKGTGAANGPFLYTGFRPRFFIQKRRDSSGSWRMWDSARHPYNPNDAILRCEDAGAEDTANGIVDFLSNGVKIRMSYADMNADGGDYVYMCWGDVPYKTNNTF